VFEPLQAYSNVECNHSKPDTILGPAIVSAVQRSRQTREYKVHVHNYLARNLLVYHTIEVCNSLDHEIRSVLQEYSTRSTTFLLMSALER